MSQLAMVTLEDRVLPVFEQHFLLVLVRFPASSAESPVCFNRCKTERRSNVERLYVTEIAFQGSTTDCSRVLGTFY